MSLSWALGGAGQRRKTVHGACPDLTIKALGTSECGIEIGIRGVIPLRQALAVLARRHAELVCVHVQVG